MTNDASFMSNNLARPQRALTPHFVVGVAWIVLWLTNLSNLIQDIAPFLNFYVFVVFFLIYYGLFRATKVMQFALNPMLWLWLVLTIIPLATYFGGDYPYQHAWSDTKYRLTFLSTVASVGLVLSDDEGPRVLRTAATVALVFTLFTFFLELMVYNPYNRATGRSAGLFGDANTAANALLIMLILSQDVRRQTLRSMAIVGITMLGIITTLSRSAMLIALFLCAIYVFVPRGRGTFAMGARLAVTFAGIFFIVLAVSVSVLFLDIDTSEGWRIFSVLTLDLKDTSSQGRLNNLLFALGRFYEFFWTGRGPGAAHHYGVYAHNAYVTLGYEYGIFAVIIYVLLICQGYFKAVRYGLQRSLTAVILSTQIAWYSLFDHTVHAQPATAIVFAVMMSNVIIADRGEAPTQDSGEPSRPLDLR